MRLFYTGAGVKDGIQENPLQSLGGYISNLAVPNSRLGSTFPDLDSEDLKNGSVSVIGLILKNETGATVTDINIFADILVTANSKYELAAVTVNSNGSIEKINDTKSLPYVGTFYDIMGIGNVRTISASLPAGGLIGIWLKRIVTAVPSKTCTELYNATEPPETKEELKLVINYT